MNFCDKNDIIQLTSKWTGERLPDGRPKVPDEDLAELRNLTLEEVWQPLFLKGYNCLFEEKLKRLHDDKRKLIGRAVTCTFVPSRPDLEEITKEIGEEEGRKGTFNQWVIDSLVEGDVVVADMYDKIYEGTFVGGNLTTAIKNRTKTGGAVVWGGIRDLEQIEGIDDFKNNTNIDITEKEYQEIFGNYILYLVQIDVDDENVTNGENAIDVYLFAKDNKMVCTIRVMNSYATKGMIGQAKDSKEDVDKSEIKERLLLAISSIRQDIMDNPTLQLKEYCNREVLQNEISRATINEFTWENDIGNGTITNEEGKTYNFTIDSNYQVDVSDVID